MTSRYKLKGSFGASKVYRYWRKMHWIKDIPFFDLQDLSKIMLAIGEEISRALIEGNEVLLPYNYGSIAIAEYKPTSYMKDGKIRTTRKLDMWATRKYRMDHPDEKDVCIYHTNDTIYRILYKPTRAQNARFFKFQPYRSFRKAVAKAAKEGTIRAHESIQKSDIDNNNYGNI